jgi:hypothetical protein
LARNIAAVAIVAALLAAATAGAQSLIDGGDVRNNSLTGKDVRNKSLTKQDFRGSVRGPRGPRGLSGPQGPAGPPGPTVLGAITRTETVMTVPAGGIDGPVANCPAGQALVSGGFRSVGGGFIFGNDSFGSRTSWSVLYDNFFSSTSAEVRAIAYCSPAGQAATPASVERPTTRIRAAIEAQRRSHGMRAAAAKPCSAGYTHAVMPDGAHKCLRAGQFCSHKRGWQRAYHRYGFHCKRSGRLTYY